MMGELYDCPGKEYEMMTRRSLIHKKENIVRALYHGTLAVLGFVLLPGTAFAQPSGTDPTIVQVEGGTVRGALANGVISWKGIPYAAPPVGNLRWRNPQPVQPWTGVKETNRFGPACMQTDDVPKSEDCLTINVWRPAVAPAQPLLVMVWIHGGAMVHGGAPVYPLDAMAAKGVVIASMNFRLGGFGYCAHPALAAEAPNEVRGNYGFMDQLAALQWVRRNIAACGGDPNQVIIFGESAAAVRSLRTSCRPCHAGSSSAPSCSPLARRDPGQRSSPHQTLQRQRRSQWTGATQLG